jgi:SAM-dependent methyltransferase
LTYDLASVIAAYDAFAAAGSAGWVPAHWQLVLFQSLARVDGLASGARVLDVGCGMGDFKDFLAARGLEVEYVGIDVSPKMIEQGRARHPGTRLEVRDLLVDPLRERFDFVFCSGALNYGVREHSRWLADMIAAMYGLADVAVALNLLSAWSLQESPVLQRSAGQFSFVQPEEILKLCRGLTPRVAIDHHTHNVCFDVFLYRSCHAAIDRFLAEARPGRTWSPAVEGAIRYHVELGLDRRLIDYLSELEPSVEVLLHLAQAQVRLGDHRLAAATFGKAAASAPTSPWPHVGLAEIAARAGAVDEAVDHLRRALELEPRNAAATERLARILCAAGRSAEARPVIAQLAAGPLRDLLEGLADDESRSAR